MKKLMLCLYFLAMFFIANAQTNQVTFIKQLDQHNAATLVKNDTVSLKKYLAEDFLLNSSGNNVSIGSKRILSAIRSGRLNYVQFDVVTDTVYFINKKTAISMGSELAATSPVGSVIDDVHKRRYTNVWIKEKGTWKLKARHSSFICAS